MSGVCFIAPPDLLSRMVESEDAAKRQAALRTLAASASVRSRRSLLTRVMRDLDVDARRFAPSSDERQTVYDVEHRGSHKLPGRIGDSPGGKSARMLRAYLCMTPTSIPGTSTERAASMVASRPGDADRTPTAVTSLSTSARVSIRLGVADSPM